MPEAERIGQLFMVGESSADPNSALVAQAITQYHAGGVLLYGTGWSSATLVRAASQRAQNLADANVGGIGLLVAGNQEGGRQGSLQAFYGPGFATIPPALVQGTLPPATLESDAHVWGSQLESAGINLDLAPVMDTVPADMATTNAPIGQLDREYGHDPQTVAVHGSAFIRGMLGAGVQVTEKHFPGLGRVQGNTDFTADVTDSVTTRHDPFLEPFEAGIQAGAGFVMVSTAIYTRIDPTQQAVFSPVVIGRMLRGDLGFQGVVISDDLGQAVAVNGVPVPERALRFLAAGGDIVLTQAPSDIGPMEAAVLQRMTSDPAFAAEVSASVRRVLMAKERMGLLPAC
jgi:beta-N-acetylhexosaminidase